MPSTITETFHTMAYGPALEDATEVHAWLDAHHRAFGHYIDGAFTPVDSNTFETRNPATGDLLATVSLGTEADVDRAVAAATKALPAWQALTHHERARHLYALARQVQKHARRLAVLETLDNGKSIRETRDIDIPLVARHFYHHAGWAQLLDTEFPAHTGVGVVGQIIPWNFPLLMFAWKVAPALAAGCTIVIKPAEYTPLTAILFAEIAHDIGLPPGVLNVVHGDGSTGAAIVAHPGIQKIAFTGSTEVGRIIRKATAATPKKLSLELGGKSPFIVFDDADLDSAVEGLVDGIWFNQGQVCCAGSRLLVQERVAERLYDKIRARMATLRIGPPLDKSIDIGAIVDKVQYDRIASLVATGIAEGATCFQPTTPLPTTGLFYPPTLLTNISPAATVAQVEIFGPVLTAMTFRTPAEAVELANNTVYGLAASIWSENINVALDIAAQVKAGVVWINATNLFDAACGFGGYRESGYGREGGKEGMYEYLEPSFAPTKLSSRPERSAVERPASGTSSDASPSHLESRISPLESRISHLAIPRTIKQYINGKQARPDSGYTTTIHNLAGQPIGEVPAGSRKDIRNAVEAARNAATKWAKTTAHARAQILYYLAENMAAREHEITAHLAHFTIPEQASREFAATIARTFTYAAWADKFEGTIHTPPAKMVTLAMVEPIGVLGLLAPDDSPLLGLMSLILPAVAMGNTVVAVPSETAATILGELYPLLDTSDVPAGVINLVAGRPLDLGKTLAEHDDVDAIWSFRDQAAATLVKTASIGNLKQTFTNEGHPVDWLNPTQSEGRHCLRHATQIKNIWVPYGE